MSTRALPPGPALPSFLQLLRFRTRPIPLWEECARRYGDCFTLRFSGTPPFVMFTDPAAIQQIFTGEPDTLRAGELTKYFEFLLGPNSLVLLDGARHLRERRLMLPPFHGERMQAYATLIRDVTDRAVGAWPVGRPFPLYAEMQAITLEVIMRAVFGVEEHAKLDALRQRLVRYLEFTNGWNALLLVLPALQRDLGPLTPWRRFVRNRTDVDELLFAEIARRRREGTSGRTDVLSMLVDARDEHGQPMTDAELRDEMFTLLGAGHETTATSLAWVFHRLLTNPEVLETLLRELAAVVGDGPVEAQHLGALPYLDAVLKETARLDPVIHLVGRVPTTPMRIGGRELPAGVVLAPNIYLTHRRPDLWPEPTRFDPARFVGARTSPYAFFPFGGGVRRCIGAAFATYEMKIIVAEILTRATLRQPERYRAHPVARVATVAPSEGMPVILDRAAA
jgi:cytochrome P450